MSTTNQLLAENIKNQFGLNAAPTPITGTNAVTPPTGQVWEAVQIWTANTRIASFTINGTPITSFSGVDLPSGFILYGSITSITLSTGTALGYVRGDASLAQ